MMIKANNCGLFNQMHRIKLPAISLILLCMLIMAGCASVPKQGNVLAVVDGEPLTVGDLEYSLQIAHRREDLSSARTLDINHYIQKLIDESLIIQEAGRMGMDQYPEVRKKIRAYVIRESVVKLHDEEVIKKVSVTDDDVNDYYKKNYETFVIDMIKADTEEEAGEILDKLKNGGSFKEYAEKYPSGFPNKGDKGYTYKLNSLGPALRATVAGMKPGEITGAIPERNAYIIVKLIERQEAPDDKLEQLRASIEDTLRKLKIKERENEYLSELKEKADIKINEKILSSIKLDGDSDEKKKWLSDSRPVLEINGDVLTTANFAAMLSSASMNAKERIMNSWIERKVVDQEAIGRHYELKSDLKDRLWRYKNKLIRNEFIGSVIVPRVNLTEDDVKDYYISHRKDYLKPVEYKVRQITLNSREEADKVLKSLRGGASFSWMVKMKSKDNYASMGGSLGWKKKKQFEGPISNIIDSLKPGDISEALETGSGFKIIRLQEKSDEEVVEFENVRPDARRKAFKMKMDEIYNEYVNELKKEADIKLNDSTIRSFEEMFDK